MTLKEIRAMVIPFCKPVKNSKNIFSFTIDTKKLEEEISKQGFHVIGLSDTLKSYHPTVNDLPYLVDFVPKKNVMDQLLLNDQSEILMLTIFQEIEGKKLPDNIYERMNDPKKIDTRLVTKLISKAPCYRILISKKYVEKHDSLTYSTRIRHNLFNLRNNEEENVADPEQADTTESVEEGEVLSDTEETTNEE